MSGFHVGGAVPVDAQAYVQRDFERAVLGELAATRWVLLLGPRQHGKSSGLLRIQAELRRTGVQCALVDMQAMPLVEHAAQAIEWFTGAVARDLGLLENLDSGCGSELLVCLERLELNGGRVVIMVDEAAAISDDRIRENFYGQLRAIANRRARVSSDDLCARLTFVFAGTFRPERLVANPKNSPLNVCERVDTGDLSFGRATELWANVMSSRNRPLVHGAYKLVGGQPYLLQRIFDHAVRAGVGGSSEIDEQISAAVTSGGDGHLTGLFGHIEDSPELFGLADELNKGSVPYVPAQADLDYLCILGFARRDGQRVVVRNRLYSQMLAALGRRQDAVEFPSITGNQ